MLYWIFSHRLETLTFTQDGQRNRFHCRWYRGNGVVSTQYLLARSGVSKTTTLSIPVQFIVLMPVMSSFIN